MRGTITGADEAEIILKLHDLSMSKNPDEARFGRGMKEMVPALRRWLFDEADRGSSPIDCMTVLPGVFASLLTTAVATYTKPGMHDASVALVLAQVAKEVLRMSAEVEKVKSQ